MLLTSIDTLRADHNFNGSRALRLLALGGSNALKSFDRKEPAVANRPKEGTPVMKQHPMVLWLIVVVLLLARPAHAYLDPGSGSMILQLILGGVAGLLVILKLYWRRLLAVLRLRKDVEPAADEPQA